MEAYLIHHLIYGNIHVNYHFLRFLLKNVMAGWITNFYILQAEVGVAAGDIKTAQSINRSFTETVPESELTDGTNGSLYKGRLLKGEN